MILYAESNFVLEIALAQEEAAVATALLEMGRRGEVELWVPSFALCEPFTTVGRRLAERQSLARSVESQLSQLERSPAYDPLRLRLADAPAALVDVSTAQDAGLARAVEAVLAVARLIEFGADVFADAMRYRRLYGFSTTQDAIVYASVVAGLRVQPPAVPKCFVTRNPADFEKNPKLRAELNTLGCVLKSNFRAARGHVGSQLRGGAGAEM